MSWLILHYYIGRWQWSHCSMPGIRFQEVKLLVSESLRTAKSLNIVKWFSFTDCTISMTSMIEAYEVDAGISGSSVKTSVILASWKSHLCYPSSLFHYWRAWKSAGGTATSSWWRNFRMSTSRITETASSRQNNTCQCQVSAYNPFICESFHHYPIHRHLAFP